MAISPRDQIASWLAGTATRGSFSARVPAPADNLDIDVNGLGHVDLPVPPAQARALCGLARPARYGKGTETLLDPGVRDTGEIPQARCRDRHQRRPRRPTPSGSPSTTPSRSSAVTTPTGSPSSAGGSGR